MSAPIDTRTPRLLGVVLTHGPDDEYDLPRSVYVECHYDGDHYGSHRHCECHGYRQLPVYCAVCQGPISTEDACEWDAPGDGDFTCAGGCSLVYALDYDDSEDDSRPAVLALEYVIALGYDASGVYERERTEQFRAWCESQAQAGSCARCGAPIVCCECAADDARATAGIRELLRRVSGGAS